MGYAVIWVSHPFGNANVRAVLRAFYGRNMLERFYTTLAFSHNNLGVRMLPSGISAELQRRSFPIPSNFIYQGCSKEILRQASIRLGLGKWSNSIKSPIGIDAVWMGTDARLAKDLLKQKAVPRAVYSYEDGSLASFRAAKKCGVKCIYDQPIGYFESAQRIFAEDRERMPEFAGLLEGIHDTPEKLERKREEAMLADVIVSCSDFVTKTLTDSGVSRGKICEVQFGVPSKALPKVWSDDDERGPLKILFVGRISQRKGIGYLLKAVEALKTEHYELHILGPVSGDDSILDKYRKLFHYHSPAPQEKVFELMRKTHVLVMPSLFEGQALVILEAMKVGLPVIVTPNTGVGKLVKNGENGFFVSVGSHVEIQEKLQWMLENRKSVPTMGTNAREHVKEITWDSYEDALSQKVLEILREDAGHI